MLNYLLALVLTIVVEFIIISFFIRKKYISIFLYSALINCFTWPIANYFYGGNFSNFIIIEMAVFLVEGVLIKLLFEINYKKAFLIAFVANIVTAFMTFLF